MDQEFFIQVSVTATTKVVNQSIDWQFVPIDQYEVPSLPVKGSAAQAWTRFLQSVRASDSDSQPFRHEDDLRSLSHDRLVQLCRPIPWADVADAFVERTQLALKQSSTLALVLPPHAGLCEIIEALAHTLGWKVLSAPNVEDLINGAPKWLKANERHLTGRQPWIIPDLSRLFLRHVQGLSLVKHLYARIASDSIAAGLIGCDSWAWKYIERVCGPFPIPVFTQRQANASDLQKVLQALLNNARTVQWQIKDSSSGDVLINQAEEGQLSDAAVFIELAAASRGNLPLALHYWLARLRDEPEVDDDTSDEDASKSEGSHNPPNCVWVGAVTPEPKWPTVNYQECLLLLHSLLLHNGQPRDRLLLTLESLTGQIDGLLARLLAAGFIECTQACWRVTPMAYPMVRRALQSRAFLVDSF